MAGEVRRQDDLLLFIQCLLQDGDKLTIVKAGGLLVVLTPDPSETFLMKVADIRTKSEETEGP